MSRCLRLYLNPQPIHSVATQRPYPVVGAVQAIAVGTGVLSPLVLVIEWEQQPVYNAQVAKSILLTLMQHWTQGFLMEQHSRQLQRVK